MLSAALYSFVESLLPSFQHFFWSGGACFGFIYYFTLCFCDSGPLVFDGLFILKDSIFNILTDWSIDWLTDARGVLSLHHGIKLKWSDQAASAYDGVWGLFFLSPHSQTLDLFHPITCSVHFVSVSGVFIFNALGFFSLWMCHKAQNKYSFPFKQVNSYCNTMLLPSNLFVL